MNSQNTCSDCYVEPSCTGHAFYDPSTGFTNDTGWSSTGERCCQICLPGTNKTVCFNDDVNCRSKEGTADYDYLMLDQLWIPQFCSALLQGRDLTLSHLSGMSCGSTSALLTIHGLWPNYFSGYPQCCSQMSLVPQEMRKWSIWPELQENWVDATEKGGCECSACFLWNHEWQKHGSCYSNDPMEYFSAGLLINQLLQDQSRKMVSFSGQFVNGTDLAAVYAPWKINLICDPHDSDNRVGRLSEIQSCWKGSGSIFSQVDCKPAAKTTFAEPCPMTVYLASGI